jgi:hypothetical protein
MVKILDVRWFCGSTNIGIVCVDTPWAGIKYYIGSCPGADEESDKQYIADWGTIFPNDAGDVLFGVKND